MKVTARLVRESVVQVQSAARADRRQTQGAAYLLLFVGAVVLPVALCFLAKAGIDYKGLGALVAAIPGCLVFFWKCHAQSRRYLADLENLAYRIALLDALEHESPGDDPAPEEVKAFKAAILQVIRLSQSQNATMQHLDEPAVTPETA